MSLIVDTYKRLSTQISESKVQLRLSLRVTVSAIATWLVAQLLGLPLGGLWAVLTSVIVTQMSIGGSLKATIEYSVGTLGGAIYAGAIATLLPPDGELTSLIDLAIVVAPLALLAAFNPNFRVAPFTAVIVVVGSTATHAGPLASAFYRVIEVETGGAVGLVVSYLVLPERADALARQAAARMIDIMAETLPELIAGVMEGLDEATLLRLQNAIGDALARYNAAAAEARHERLQPFSTEHAHGPLARTLLRLRHDFVMIGRASVAPLPQSLQARLAPLLTEITAAATEFLRACSFALAHQRNAPPLLRIDRAFERYAAEIAALRREGATHRLPEETVEHFFMLGFVLEQVREHFKDLSRCINEASA
jgi:uncharacterized membrane protein YccC